MPPPALPLDALVKRATLASIVGLVALRFFQTWTAALIAVAFFYLLLIVRNAAG
jgi:hypothetical protein